MGKHKREAIRKHIIEGRSPHVVAAIIIIEARGNPGDWKLSARTQLAAVYKLWEDDAMAIVSEMTGTLSMKYRRVVNKLEKDIAFYYKMLDNQGI